MFNTDLPISGAKGDRLGRGEIARSIACALYAQDSGEPLVLGISGKWGTGKTSLANLVIEKLMEAEDANSAKAKTMVFQYSAWMAANGDGLVSRFLDQFSGFLCHPNRSLEAKKIGEKLVRYSKCFTPLSLLPGVGGLSELIKKTFESVGEASKGIGDQLAVDVQGCKQEISEALKTGKQRVLIIFDDIDRLTVREIQQVFQLIKAVADFPFTSYLLLYDEEIVCQALNEITGSEGHDFLGKIIQVPIRIPLPQPSQIYGVLFEELDRIIKGSTLLFFEQEYWVNVFHHGLKRLFRHLRDVKRFTNLLQFKIAALTDQVNFVDLCVLTGMELFFPKIHTAICFSLDLLTYGINDLSRDDDKEEVKVFVEKVSNAAETQLSSAIVDVLALVFPKLQRVTRNTSYGSGHHSQWRGESRACIREMAEMYLSMAFPIGKTSNSTIRSLFDERKTQQQIHLELETLQKKGLILDALMTMENFTDSEFTNVAISRFLKTFFQISDTFPEERGGNVFLSHQCALLPHRTSIFFKILVWK